MGDAGDRRLEFVAVGQMAIVMPFDQQPIEIAQKTCVPRTALRHATDGGRRRCDLHQGASAEARFFWTRGERALGRSVSQESAVWAVPRVNSRLLSLLSHSAAT